MSKVKKYIPWLARIVIFGLFMLSGISKLFPLWMFEKQLVDLGIASWCVAPFLARLIIALEIAIAIAILFNHHIKRIVIPVTIALLVAFNIHLSIEMVKHGAMNGNCGCFGQLLPMTPLEAFIKNLLTIGILIYLFKVLRNKPKGENKFSYLLIMYLGSALLMFMAFAHDVKPCLEEKNRVQSQIPSSPPLAPDALAHRDSMYKEKVAAKKGLQLANLGEAPDAYEEEKSKETKTSENNNSVDESSEVVTLEKGPDQRSSRFAPYTNFNGKTVNLDQGKQIICLFAAGCDHCQETAKELAAIDTKGILPPLHIIFMDEETFKIPEFFKKAGKQYPYTVVDIPTFWQLLGDGALTPGVVYSWNGNFQKVYQGTEDAKFSASDLESLLTK